MDVRKLRFFSFLIMGMFPLATPRAVDWRVSVEALTDIPVQVGGHLDIEGPCGFRLSTSVGVLPGAYVDLINAVVVEAGGYDQKTADLVHDSLKNSLVWRLHLGWRPFTDHGFYFEIGYGLAALGGDVVAEQLITLATGTEPPADSVPDRHYDVSSVLHMIDVEAGWAWKVWRELYLRAALGFAGTLVARTDINPKFRPVVRQAVERFCAASEEYLNGIYTSYVFSPVISLAAGWQF